MAQRGGIVGNLSASGAPTWRAGELQEWERDFLQSGVIQGIGSALAVSQKAAGANMSVDVAAGRALYEITTTLLTPNETHKIYHDSDAVENVVIDTADATNPRIDIIIMKFDPSVTPNTAASNHISITKVTGTPAGSPAVPATPSNCFKLAQIAVAAGATSIVNANITDSRVYAKFKTTVLTDLVRQGLGNMIATASGTDTITATYDPPVTAWADKMILIFVPANNNTGAVTFNPNGIGAKDIKKLGSTALVAADLKAKVAAMVQYNLTDDNLKLISLLGNAPPGSTNYDIEKYINAADGSAVGTSSTALVFSDSTGFTISANDLIAGVAYEFEFSATISWGAGTVNPNVYFGTSELHPTYQFTPNADRVVNIRGTLYGTAAAGASVAVRCESVMTCNRVSTIAEAPSTTAHVGTSYAANSFATNGTLQLRMGNTFGTSNGGNSFTQNTFRIRRICTTAS